MRQRQRLKSVCASTEVMPDTNQARRFELKNAEETTLILMPLSAFDWRAYDAYLFDIDGTLLNTHDGVHYNSFHTALREVYGCEGRIDAVPVHGNTDIGILRAALAHHHALDDGEFESKLPQALAMMCAEVERNADGIRPELCPSIADLLAALHGEGKLLGVVTGNLERIGWSKLERAGIRKYFDFGSFSDSREKREDIFRSGVQQAQHIRGPQTRICFVGDTPSDIRAASSLGLPVIAVATGIYSREQLVEHAPPLCVGTVAELLKSSF
jgi:phosphoglycolate phosphatase-like HAD superfamily hydrolase